MSGPVLAAVALLVAPVAVGAALLRALAREDRSHGLGERLATSWLLGQGWIGSVLLALAVAGVTLQPAVAWPAALLPLALIAWRRQGCDPSAAGAPRRIDEPASGAGRVLVLAVWLLVAFYFARAVPECLATPMRTFDGVGIWGLKALAIHHDRGIDPAFFTLDRDAPMHPDYPLLQPMFGAWLLLNLGTPDEGLLKTPSLLAWACLILLLHGFGRRRIGSAAAVALAAAFGLVEIVYQHALVATADLLFAVLGLRAILGVIRHAEDADPAELRLAAVFFALAAATKNEGWALGTLGAAVVAATATRAGLRARLRRALVLVGVMVAVNLPWLVFRWHHGLHTDLFQGEFLFGDSPDSGPPPGPARIPYLLARAASIALGEPFPAMWNGFWPVALVAGAATLVRWRASPPAGRILVVFLVAMGVAYLAALAISPHDIRWHVDTAARRLLLHLAVTAAALILVTLGAFRSAIGRATIGSGPAGPAPPPWPGLLMNQNPSPT